MFPLYAKNIVTSRLFSLSRELEREVLGTSRRLTQQINDFLGRYVVVLPSLVRIVSPIRMRPFEVTKQNTGILGGSLLLHNHSHFIDFFATL